ncbi:MAG: sialidase family protein, partial [Bradymonadia bacterium]
ISTYSDKIIIVLSGDRTTRKAYIVDEGVDPAVASHGSGRVLTMHSDGGERLWYWTGRLSEDEESVQWLHHGRYDTGTDPAIVFVNRDTVVEVHRSHSRDRLFAALGRFDEQGRITWFDERSLFDGKSPSLSLMSDGRIVLIYEEGGSSGRRREAYGQITGESVTFEASRPTTAALFQTSNNGEIEVISSDANGNNERTLLYRLAAQRDFDFIRYEQLMFTEYQSGDDSFLAEHARFAGFGSGSEGALEQHNSRYVTRLWSYDEGDARSALQPNLLSTDEPFARWFNEKMRNLSAIDW